MKELTVCIPIKNDSQHLDSLMESFSVSDINRFKYEIIICDGGSTDGIEEVVQKWKSSLNITLAITENGTASINLNKGISLAKFEVFCRIDSHCLVAADFFSNGMDELASMSSEACAVGPIIDVYPTKPTFIGKAISKAFMSPFFMGPSKFKKSNCFKNQSGSVDTIYLGFFFTNDLREINGFNERIKRKQDIDLLRRLKTTTKKYLFQSSKAKIKYTLKQDNLDTILSRAYSQGVLTTQYLDNIRFQHLIPITSLIGGIVILLLFPNSFTLLAILYLFISFLFLMIESKQLLPALLFCWLFPACHSAYILGNFKGFLERLKN